MSFTGWAVTLGGVTVTFACDQETPCATTELLLDGVLNAPPSGLGLPGVRSEDQTYPQRDGVKHFDDWYLPRFITLVGTIGPDEPECSMCTTARQQLAALLAEWRRSCCDIELVIHTPCDGQFVEGVPILGEQSIRRNLIRNPSFEEDAQFWAIPSDTFCRGYDRCYTEDGGTTWCYSNPVDGDFTTSVETDGGWVGNNYFRLTNDIPPTMPGIGFTYAPTAGVTELAVTETNTYTSSAYLRASDPMDVVAQILWFDSLGALIGVSSGSAIEAGTDWTRVHVTATAPEGVDHAYAQWATTEVADWTAGDTLDIDGALFETGPDLLTYFDGDTADSYPVDDPTVGEQVIYNLWAGNPNLSVSIQSVQTYEENLDRSLYGPVGVVGRPRVFQYEWLPRDEQIANFTARFDGTDQRMYVLDECGTPGFQECRTITPGVAATCRTYDLCYTSGGRCYTDNASVSLTFPVTAPVRGTERVYPLIVLYPGLSYPTVENMSSSEFIKFNGVVTGEPIQIDTENGTAEGVQTGASYTHLLGGSIFMSMVPGNNDFRMFTNASEDTGNAQVCWRDSIVGI